MKNKFKLLTCLLLIYSGLHAQHPHNFGVTAAYSGTNGYGAILKSDSTGHQFVQVASFNNFNGSYPAGDIVMVGNGKIYGICEHGGVGNSCTLYSFDTTTNIISKLHDFSLSFSDGDIPMSGLILGNDCKLYGATAAGGADSGGVIFSFDPSTNTYTDVYDFVDSTGKEPFGQLALLNDGKIYGTTGHGGFYGVGTIFSFDPVTHIHTDLYDFDGITGGDPWYSKLIQAPDGNLYGTTPYSGDLGGGVLYRFDPLTSNYSALHNFAQFNGGSPFGKVAYANGKIYGVTKGYTSSFRGMLFSYDLSTDTFIAVMNFDSINGANPWRGLNLNSYGILMGTTAEGGTNNLGVIFSFDPTTNTYEKLFDFAGSATGNRPDCDVLEIDATTNPCIPMQVPEKNKLPVFSIFPNPSEGEFTISGLPLEGTIEIYNVMGEKVYHSLINSKSEVINSRNFLNGLYFVKVNDGEKAYTQKLIKE